MFPSWFYPSWYFPGWFFPSGHTIAVKAMVGDLAVSPKYKADVAVSPKENVTIGIWP